MTVKRRVSETTIWKQPWFQELKVDHKNLWFYLRDECDHGGVFTLDPDRARSDLGVDVLPESLDALFAGRLERLGDRRWRIVGFVESQNGPTDHGMTGPFRTRVVDGNLDLYPEDTMRAKRMAEFLGVSVGEVMGTCIVLWLDAAAKGLHHMTREQVIDAVQIDEDADRWLEALVKFGVLEFASDVYFVCPPPTEA